MSSIARKSTDEFFPILYRELRKLARSRMAKEAVGHALQTTALVHEVYLRLVKTQGQPWANRAHFFSSAAIAMRRILVEEARRRRSRKHGGKMNRVSLGEIDIEAPEFPFVDVLVLDEALKQLEKKDARRCQVVMLRYFAGLDVNETAKLLGVSPATVDRDWFYAKAWLLAQMQEPSPSA